MHRHTNKSSAISLSHWTRHHPRQIKLHRAVSDSFSLPHNHLYTIFLVIANIHLRSGAPSISRYPFLPSLHRLISPPPPLLPGLCRVLPPPGPPNALSLLIYDGYLQDHACRVKTFYNCTAPRLVSYCSERKGDYAESSWSFVAGNWTLPRNQPASPSTDLLRYNFFFFSDTSGIPNGIWCSFHCFRFSLNNLGGRGGGLLNAGTTLVITFPRKWNVCNVKKVWYLIIY